MGEELIEAAGTCYKIKDSAEILSTVSSPKTSSTVYEKLPETYDQGWFSADLLSEDESFSSVYAELRTMARFLLLGERFTPTIQATELVNEGLLKFFLNPIEPKDKQHLLALLTRYMRQVLIDRARRRNAGKRAGHRVTLDPEALENHLSEDQWDRFESGLAQLEQENPTLSLVFHLHYFGDLSMADIAGLLNKSDRTIKRYWKASRLFLTDLVLEGA